MKIKNIKLLADGNIPVEVINEFSASGINIRGLNDPERNRSDDYILELANKEARVLLTLDKDFWDDNKTPLNKVKSGIIYVASSNTNTINPIIDSFALAYLSFAKYYPSNWWHNMKVKATTDYFLLKFRTWEGRIKKC